MSAPEHLEQVGDVACLRLQGRMTLAAAIAQATQAIAWARAQKIPKLLINATGLEGVTSPNLAERYFYMREFAAHADGYVKLAAVLPREVIDPGKFGVLVGRNVGLENDVFTTEAEALAWLTGGARA